MYRRSCSATGTISPSVEGNGNCLFGSPARPSAVGKVRHFPVRSSGSIILEPDAGPVETFRTIDSRSPTGASDGVEQARFSSKFHQNGLYYHIQITGAGLYCNFVNRYNQISCSHYGTRVNLYPSVSACASSESTFGNGCVHGQESGAGVGFVTGNKGVRAASPNASEGKSAVRPDIKNRRLPDRPKSKTDGYPGRRTTFLSPGASAP